MKRIINTLLLLSVAIIAMAQTSFVVADKNGNSQLVQSLVFQQQQTADRFSWKSDGLATGDINDLLFIARAKAELATASNDDVTEMLEQLSGTGQADAGAIAAALENNPNVEEAYTEDGGNLIVKNIDGEGDVVYPMYEMMSPFSDIQIPEQNNYSKQKRMPRKASKQYPKVAIFNFFEDMNQYKVQNLITRNIEWDFYLNGYDVDYYTPNNSDPSLRFTYKNLGSVLYSSKNYAAIIIMTHGAWVKGESCLCTGELAGKNDKSLYNWADKKYYKRYPADIQAESNCILYLGICNGPGKDGFNSMSPTIGYTGPTRMAQANAAMMFYLMLNEGYNLKKAVSALQPEPAPYQNTEIYKSNNVDSQMLESETYSERDYFEDSSVHYWLENKGDYSRVHGRFDANGDKRPRFAWIEYVPIICNDFDMMEAFYDYHHDNFPSVKSITGVDEDGWFDVNSYLRKLPENIYICRIEGWTKSEGKRMVEPFIYRFRIVSENFKENSAEVEDTEESVSTPSILDSSNQPTEEITVATGVTSSFEIDGYSGHSFWALSLDEDIAKVSVSGTMLTVTGVTEGTTYIGVQDHQNKLIAVAKVTVTTVQPHVNLCPDDHHPHMIDLGLPSGTKWACCNVGASKPEDYGGYYAWGETEDKYCYEWSTYIHCDNGDYLTCHDIGKDIAGTKYDAATAIWGSSWVMPNKEQMEELINNCTSEWTTENNVSGCRFTGSNGVSIFLPAAGRWQGTTYVEGGGNYWSSSQDESEPIAAYYLDCYDGVLDCNSEYGSRVCGLSVRPVVGGSPRLSSCPDSHHPHMIDLGLPSGTKWACCNVGAEKPEDYGGYFAWGETAEKTRYYWETYTHCDGSSSTCHDIGKDIAGTQYDAATANWGSPWVMPSLEQMNELKDKCTSEWTTENGVNGRRFTGPNGASIFLPAAGDRFEDDLRLAGSFGVYWSSSLYESFTRWAWYLYFNSGDVDTCIDGNRNEGLSVRPVRQN